MTDNTWHRWLAIAVSVGLIGLAGYLLVVGTAVNIDEIGGTPSSDRESQVSAAIPLLAGVMYLSGLIWRRRTLVIGSAVVLTVYGALFLFSVGPYYAPIGIVMWILGIVTSRHWDSRSNADVDIGAG
ncbi:MAG TPA: hypothetical protein VLS86_03690 [Acidimicrobiia bacterium]|nr:hypothetical protein [Acidimicrobiia bacterium]